MRWVPTYWLIDRVTGRRRFHLGHDFPAEKYTVGKKEDHAHCSLCGATFSDHEGHLSDGFYSEAEGWLCEPCHREIMAGTG